MQAGLVIFHLEPSCNHWQIASGLNSRNGTSTLDTLCDREVIDLLTGFKRESTASI